MSNATRKVLALDSFEGHPTLEGQLNNFSGSKCAFLQADFDDVKEMLRKHKVDSVVTPVKGWIQDTIPTLDVDQIAVLLVDVDSYDAIKFALESLYPRVPLGGAIVIDDYNFYQEARDAVNDFLWDHDIAAPLYSSHPDARVIWFKDGSSDI